MASVETVLTKDLPQKEKDLIDGFIREIQALFPKDTAFYNIPISINHICALFYHLYVFDKWDPEYICSRHKVTKNGYCIEHTQWHFASAYGSVIVKSPGIHRWKFRLHSVATHYWNIVLGVWKTKSADEPSIGSSFTSTAKGIGEYKYGHAFDLTMGKLIGASGQKVNGSTYGKKCVSGDIIEIELDLNLFTLSYIINNQDMGTAFKDIEDTEYRVALSTNKPSKGYIIIEMLQ